MTAGLAARYRALDRAARPLIEDGGIAGDPLPRVPDLRWGLSLVLRPPRPLADQLALCANRLAQSSRAFHVPYRSNGIHLTVRSLEGYVEEIPQEVIAEYQHRIKHLITGLPAITVEMQGVGASSSGVLAHGYPSPALDDLRQRLAQDAMAHPWLLARSGDEHRIRNTAHATLLLFRQAALPDPGLLEMLSRVEHYRFGSFATNMAELVTYRVFADRIEVENRATIHW